MTRRPPIPREAAKMHGRAARAKATAKTKKRRKPTKLDRGAIERRYQRELEARGQLRFGW